MDDQTSTESPEQRLASLFGAPEAAPPKTEAPVETEVAEEVEAAEEGETPETPEGEALEIDGVTYTLPPDLATKVKEMRDGTLRQQDYTQKTQQLAAVTKQLTTLAEVAQTNEQFEREVAPQKGELERIKHTLAEYKKLDWASLDPQQFMQFRNQMDTLKERASEINEELSGKKEQLKKYHDTQRSEVLKAGRTYLTQNIKGWSEGHEKEVVTQGKDLGFTDEELGHMYDARIVRALWKANQFDKLQAGKSAALATVQKAPPVVKPGAVNNTAAASKQKALLQRHKTEGSVQSAAALFKRFM
jgi:small-conductance mechanosensitive channel